MEKGQAILLHSLSPPPTPVLRMLEERGFTVFLTRTWQDAERTYSAEAQIRYILIDITLCENGWHKFIDKVRTDPSGAVLICFHPSFPYSLHNLIDHTNKMLATHGEERTSELPMVGESQKFRDALELANRYAQHDITVLITGETGTGKEVMTQYVHARSSRKDRPLVACNITAIPETLVESELFGYVKGAFTGADRNKTGLIEAAEGGTLFLDEIGDLPCPTQLKLLRFLESREFYKVGESSPKTANVRIITSTNRDLDEAVNGSGNKEPEGANGFRKDLYYRLNSARIILPPLRERREDVIPLTNRFIGQACRQTQKPFKKVSSAVKVLFLDYPWPGNIRELKNVIESAVMVSDGEDLIMGDLPMQLQHYATHHREEISSKAIRNFEEGERDVILSVMKETNSNKVKAAEILGISTRTLYRKLEKSTLKAQQ